MSLDPASLPPKEHRRPWGHEVTRIEAFSDAVFAFAATLVVSLEMPRTYPELTANLRGFIAFGLSFTMLVLIWAQARAPWPGDLIAEYHVKGKIAA
jgi:uncharacterized membrane protein